VDVGGLVYVLCLLALCCSLGGGREASHGEGGRDVGRGIVEVGSGVADGGADELDVSPISSEGATKGQVLLGLLDELVVTAEAMQKPISKRMREHSLRPKDSRSGVGSAGTPRA